jgi:hypothetical protein
MIAGGLRGVLAAVTCFILLLPILPARRHCLRRSFWIGGRPRDERRLIPTSHSSLGQRPSVLDVWTWTDDFEAAFNSAPIAAANPGFARLI